MKKKRIINKHHIIYPSSDHPEQELVVPVFAGEHEIISKLSWYTRKSVSKGLIKHLKFFILLNEDRAQDLQDARKSRQVDLRRANAGKNVIVARED